MTGKGGREEGREGGREGSIITKRWSLHFVLFPLLLFSEADVRNEMNKEGCSIF